MIAGLAVISTGWQWLTSKLGLIGVLIATITMALWYGWTQANEAGRNRVLAEQAIKAANERNKANERKASIERMSPSDVRKRLHDDWSTERS